MHADEIEQQIQDFISKYINKNYTFIEQVSEATISGHYEKEDDDTVLTITPGGTKIFIIYTKK